ncbi:MAG: tetratricopeptide repeat protein [Oscillospiraceae bacterium]|nr:tetratricopeptide repeat protein [Oscillospiraceae bacterium]
MKFLKRKIKMSDLAVKLLSSASSKEDAVSMHPVRDSDHSRYRHGKLDIKSGIRDDYDGTNGKSDEEISSIVKQSFNDRIIPLLKPEREHIEALLEQYSQLICGDTSIPAETREMLLALATPETLCEFLAETFIYAVKQNNLVENGKISSEAQIEKVPEPSQTNEPTDPNAIPADSPHRLSTLLNPKNKKIIAALAAILVVVAILAGVISQQHKKPTQPVSGSAASTIEMDFDQHLLIQLANANHTYETGLTSWQFYNYPDAEAKFVAARTEISELKSQSDMDVARINNSLGCLLLEIGKYNEAETLLISAYNAFKDDPALGIESLDARAAYLSLGQCYYLKGDLENALVCTEKVVSLSDPSTEKSVLAATNHFRAKILDAQGKYNEAMQEYQTVLLSYQDIYKDGKWSEELARIMNDNGVSEEKKSYYTTAQKWIMLTYGNIGEVYIHMIDYDAALKALKTAYKMCESNRVYLGITKPFAAQIATNIAIAMSAKGKLNDAATWVDDKSIRVFRYRNDYKNGFPDLVKSYYVLGGILDKQDEGVDALEQYNTAISFSEGLLGEKHQLTAEAYHALGQYYFAKNNYQSARSNFEKAIEIRRDIFGFGASLFHQTLFEFGADVRSFARFIGGD